MSNLQNPWANPLAGGPRKMGGGSTFDKVLDAFMLREYWKQSAEVAAAQQYALQNRTEVESNPTGQPVTPIVVEGGGFQMSGNMVLIGAGLLAVLLFKDAL